MPNILGSGWALDIGVDDRGRIRLVSRERDIEEAILIILGTPRGQRRMRPEFGSLLHDLVFAPNNTTTMGLAETYVREALAMWEPRITVERVNVAPADEDLPYDTRNRERLQRTTGRPTDQGVSVLLIEIDYTIRSTLDRRTLVYPFYRIPGGE
jgi:phage baseplate assembly protein W